MRTYLVGKFKLKKNLGWLVEVISIASCISLLAIAVNYTGAFQSLELSLFDLWFRLRPVELKDPRIVVVTIDESDLASLKQWPVSDRILSKLITNIERQQPRVIGLDLYRDLEIEPGGAELERVLLSTPNLIGVEKAIEPKVKPSMILKKIEQVALADTVVDRDGKVRRGLLSMELDNGSIELSLAARLSLMYLSAEGIELQPIENTAQRSLGKTVFTPFQPYDGGYIRADAGGFQTLLNFRGTEEMFDRISMTDVLNDLIPKDLMRDRVVLIGSIAPSLNDFFRIPYNKERQQLPGVFIHANFVSQILSEAIDGRKPIAVVSEPEEWAWIFIWCGIGVTINLWFFAINSFENKNLVLIQSAIICALLPSVVLVSSCYSLFIFGWWLPVLPSLFALLCAAFTVSVYNNQKQQKLAYVDGLTQIYNRRYLDLFLAKKYLQKPNQPQNIGLILCDIDYFKKYNDTYGHQKGDRCLQQVASAIQHAIRSKDCAARYGGEEFAIVLSDANLAISSNVAQRICHSVRALKISHAGSSVGEYVSLSCGVVSTDVIAAKSPQELIAIADLALYKAKREGRDRFVLATEIE